MASDDGGFQFTDIDIYSSDQKQNLCNITVAKKEEAKDLELNGKTNKCLECGKTFGSKSNLRVHLKAIHTKYSVDEVKCLLCSKQMKNPESLKRHKKEIHPDENTERKTWICSQCGKGFNQRSNMVTHNKSAHETFRNEDVTCKICSKMLKTPYRLVVHTRVFHGDNKIRETCPDCGNTFANRKNLAIHVKTVHTVYKLEECFCNLCSKRLKNPESLKRHIHEFHPMKQEDKDKIEIPCDECGKTYKSRKYLRGHKNACHKTDKRMCDFCPNILKNSLYLQQHLKRIHGPNQNLSCEVCGKSFKNRSKLTSHHVNKHRISHNPCGECGKSYKNKWLLKKHIRHMHVK